MRRGLKSGMAVMVALWSLATVPAALAQATGAITSPPPPDSAVGATYLHDFTSTGLSPAPTYSVTAGQLPPGVIIDAQGHMFGVPTAAGTYGPTTVCASNGVQAPACQTFTVTIRKLTPIVLSQPSPGGPVGTAIRNTATVGSQQNPTGTVTFRLYSDAACTTEVFSSTNPLDASAQAVSSDFVPTVPGTYRWSVFYSGDANHDPSSFECSPVHTVTITGNGTTTTSSTTSTTTTTSTTSTTSIPPSTTSTSTSSTTSSVPPPSSTSTLPSTSTSSTSSTTSTSTTSTSVPPTSTTSSTSTTLTSTSTTATTTPPTSTSTSTSTSSTSTSSTSTSSTSTSTSSTTSTVPATTTSSTSTSSTSTSTSTTVAPISATTTTIVATTTSTTGPRPSISTDVAEAAPGQNVTVTGAGFPPGAPLVAELFSDPVQLGTTVADASGRFRMVVTVPLDTSPGLHTLRVRGVDGSPFADTSLLVKPAAAALRAAQTAILSRTGADFTRRAGLAFVLMVTGFVLVGLAWSDHRPAGFAGRQSPWPNRRRWP